MLPGELKQQQQQQQQQEHQQRFVSTDMRILLVCEDVAASGELCSLLRTTGYAVSVESARSALERARSGAGAKQQKALQQQHQQHQQQGSEARAYNSSAPDLVILLSPQNICATTSAPAPQLPSDSAPPVPTSRGPDLDLLHTLASQKLPPVVLAMEVQQATPQVVLRALEEGAADVLTLPMRRQEACMLWQHVYKAQIALRWVGEPVVPLACTCMHEWLACWNHYEKIGQA